MEVGKWSTKSNIDVQPTDWQQRNRMQQCSGGGLLFILHNRSNIHCDKAGHLFGIHIPTYNIKTAYVSINNHIKIENPMEILLGQEIKLHII